MPNLASNSVVNIFTIPASSWTVINQRVGVVLNAAPYQTYFNQLVPSYPSLLTSSQLWQSSTFNSLISQSQALATYAATAISNFSHLNADVKAAIQSGSGTISELLKQETVATLQKLSSDTTALAASTNLLTQQVLAFLNDNKVVDNEVEQHKDIFDELGINWNTVTDYLITLENDVALVTGEWSAISDDLKNTLSNSVDLSIPFLESLNIDAAIVTWQNVQNEASAFTALVAGQTQFWTNPYPS